ncbi:enoyl-CoA hydratase/isomerase family protein [Kytococcus sp. HMSC28H12]|uniref:enoyl-CoA hydratase/isomerase family protein n=1 Tax=Kytococcus sp. HMSC28H12 TaxID=1581067 RepID=UPI0008A103A7|nr:enoyl-CoA hydratase/isomerase family protein [Kytococcus sp. HMSC28H12]OFS08665.1 enoyl-CoA hydratase [Kytococcus sp. HMSC28H12]
MSEQTPLSLPGAQTTELPDLALHLLPQGTGEVAVVELALPQKRNAMSEEMTDSWARVVRQLAEHRALRAVVVTGRGSAFCAGGQLDWIVAEPDASATDLRERMARFYATWLSLGQLEVPTIAAVNGHAIGAGLAVALACDLRVVSSRATLAMPFTHLGLHPGMASTWLLPQAVGLPVARDMLLTGRRVKGHEAVGLGLASRVAEPGDVLPEALDMARAVASTAPQAERLTTVALRDGGHRSLADALQWEALAQGVTLTTADLAEGIAAAAERRDPEFTGR